jgi:poly(A) polymerase
MQLDPSPGDTRALFAKEEVHAAVHAMRQALKISNEESEQMRATLSELEPLLADAVPTVAKLKRFLAEPTSSPSRQMLDAMTSMGMFLDRIDWLRQRLADLEKTDYAPAPLIDGNVLSELGLTPGPIFKRVLDEVYDAQLEGRVRDRHEAIDLALRIAREE